MKHFILCNLIFLVTAPAAFAGKAEDRGYEIAKICDDAAKGYKGETSHIKMEIVAASGDHLSHDIDMKKKEIKRDGDRILLTVQSPADVQGTKLLTWGHADRDDEQWLYMPAIKRIKRISAKLKQGSFMGSEFAYEDLAGTDINKFKHKHIRDEKFDGRPVWVVQRSAKDSDSGYSKEVIWYDQEYKAAVKALFYDRKNELLKTASFQGYKKINKWWRPTRVKMSNAQTKNHSTMTWNDRTLKVDISESDFVSDNLKN